MKLHLKYRTVGLLGLINYVWAYPLIALISYIAMKKTPYFTWYIRECWDLLVRPKKYAIMAELYYSVKKSLW